jgi:hypothetical protein
VNSREGFGHVLQAASWKGDIDLVQSLINIVAGVDVLAGHYGTALQAAAWNGHRSVSKLLVGSTLQAASRADHYNLVEQRIKDGAAVESGIISDLQAACSQETNID